MLWAETVRPAPDAAAYFFSRRAKHEGADTIGLERGQRVRGAKADRNVGRRLESLPHKRACPTEGVKQGPEANHRQNCRCGKPGGLLHGECGARFGWRAVGEGRQGRQECRPQARKPAPQEGLPHGGCEARAEADHRQDCRCGTQDCVLHANGRHGKPGGLLHRGGVSRLAFGGGAWKGGCVRKRALGRGLTLGGATIEETRRRMARATTGQPGRFAKERAELLK